MHFSYNIDLLVLDIELYRRKVNVEKILKNGCQCESIRKCVIYVQNDNEDSAVYNAHIER